MSESSKERMKRKAAPLASGLGFGVGPKASRRLCQPWTDVQQGKPHSPSFFVLLCSPLSRLTGISGE